MADVRRANMDVRQCLSDMGTELGIADSMDNVGMCVGRPSEDSAASGHLYPLALCVPGCQHILDSALVRGLESLAWWPDWQKSAKTTCQWLGPKMHRDLLAGLIAKQSVSAQSLEVLLKSLTNAVDTFAEWRWKSLANVTKYLCRVHEAVVAATASISCATQLASGPDGQASVFLSSAQDGAFWSKARALGLLTKPITDMSSWLGGCECHEAERQRGQTVKCGWAGCRAPQLASRVVETLRQLEDVRDQVSGQTDGVSHAATTVMGTLEMKMAWVNHGPYLIRQAGPTICPK